MKGKLLLSFILLTGISVSAFGYQTKLKISVYSVNDGLKVKDAKVSLINNALSELTNEEGIAEFVSIPGILDVLSIEKEGFEGQSVFVNLEPDKLNELTFTLTPVLGELEVTADRPSNKLNDSGFYDRKEKAAGKFIDEEDIKKKRPYRVTDIFTGTAGIKLENIDGQLQVVTTRQVASQGKIFENSGPCPLRVLVDGSEIGTDLESLDSSLKVDEITAVEIYNSPAKTPIQYNRYASCGVILIWTK